jgi:hypothetical protein
MAIFADHFSEAVGRRSRAEPPGHDESLLDLTAIKKTSVDSATWRVLLVSAVPIIMTLASELSRYCVSAHVVNKAPQRTDKSKATLWIRSLKLLHRGGESAPFVEAGFKARAVNILAGSRFIGRIDMHETQAAISLWVNASKNRGRAPSGETAQRARRLRRVAR